MANIKITDLSAIADPISTDVLPIVDVSADTTNKISIEDLLKNAAAGTAAAPAFAFDADPNTGMYRSGADALAFSTGGTGRLFIDSSGNIGVGTASPDARIAVQRPSNNQGISGGISLKGQDGTIQGGIGTDGVNTNNLQILAAQGIYFHTGNTDGTTNIRATIDSSGRLGIGTTSPSAKLAIVASGNINGIEISPENSTDTNRILSFDRSTLTRTKLEIDSSEFFHTNNATETFRIDSSGNVGIKQSNPSSFYSGARNLVVGNTTAESGITIAAASTSNSNIYFADGTSSPAAYAGIVRYTHTTDNFSFWTAGQRRIDIDSSGRVGIGTASPSKKLEIAATSAEAGIALSSSGRTLVMTAHEQAGVSQAAKIGTTSNHELRIITNDTERMRIDSSGNVGINRTSPGYTLDVGGSINAYNGFLRIAGTATPSGNDPHLYRPATSSMGFWAGGSDRMRIDSSGRVGIGDTSPSTALHITNYDPVIRLEDLSSGNANIYAEIDANSASGNLFFDADPNNAGSSTVIGFKSDGTERMRIDSSGRVGIGTSSPSTKLQLGTSEDAISWASGNGIVEAPSNLYLRSVGGSGDVLLQTSGGNVGIGTGSPSYQLDVKNPTTPGESWVRVDTASSTSDCGYRFAHGGTNHFVIGHNGTSDFLQFYDNIAGSERMRIDSSGKFGFNTSTLSTAKFTFNSAGTNEVARFESTDAGAHISLKDNTSTSLNYIEGGGDLLAFGVNNSERMRIDSSGRLLVGTSSGTDLVGATNATFTTSSNTSNGGIALTHYGTSASNNAELSLRRSASSSIGTYTAVGNSRRIGTVGFYGTDGTGFAKGAEIRAETEDTWASGDIPGRLIFSTVSNGSSSLTERVRITSNGAVMSGGNINTALGYEYQITDKEGTDNGVLGLNINGNNPQITAYAGSGNDSSLIFRTTDSGNASERARILYSGGLTFNGDTAQANALDDYEEGTFTATITQSTTAPTVTYTRSHGRYTKIGKFVLVWFDVIWSAKSGGTGSPRIAGMPYSAYAVGNQSGGYGAPQFRAQDGLSTNSRLYGNSSYHASNEIVLKSFNSSGTEVDETFNSSGRVTGFSCYMIQ